MLLLYLSNYTTRGFSKIYKS